MKKNKQFMLLIFIVVALLSSSVTYAGPADALSAATGSSESLGGALGEIATELFGGNIIAVYNKSPSVFDAILLLIMFVGITTFAFKEKFGEQSKMISWSLSILLAIGGTVAFHTIVKGNSAVQQMCSAGGADPSNCGLAYLIAGPAGLAVLFVFGALLFFLIKAITNSAGMGFAIAYIFMYSLTKSFLNGDKLPFMQSVFKGLIGTILFLIYWAMIVYLVYSLIQWLVHLWSERAGHGMSAAGAGLEATSRGFNRLRQGAETFGNRAIGDTQAALRLGNIDRQLEGEEENLLRELDTLDINDFNRLNVCIQALDRLIEYNRRRESTPLQQAA